MTRQSTLARAAQIERPDLELIAQWTAGGITHDFEISRADLRRDTSWAHRLLSTYALTPGSHVVKISNGWDACWTIPMDGAFLASGAVFSNVEAWGWDARRLGSYLRRLSPVLVIGLGTELLDALEGLGDPATMLAGVEHLLVRPDAAEAARDFGLTPLLACRLGPAFGMECPNANGLHVDPQEWTLEVSPSAGLLLTSAPTRRARIDRQPVGVAAALDGSPCPCGLPGPRVRVGWPGAGLALDINRGYS